MRIIAIVRIIAIHNARYKICLTTHLLINVFKTTCVVCSVARIENNFGVDKFLALVRKSSVGFCRFLKYSVGLTETLVSVFVRFFFTNL